MFLSIGVIPDWIPIPSVHFTGLKGVLDYPESERYTVSGGTFFPEQIQEIEINWVTGAVFIYMKVIRSASRKWRRGRFQKAAGCVI